MAEYIEKIDELTRQYNDAINALSGALGRIPGVNAKATYSNI